MHVVCLRLQFNCLLLARCKAIDMNLFIFPYGFEQIGQMNLQSLDDQSVLVRSI